MSWKQAQQEADNWLSRVGYKKLMRPGEMLDLRPYGHLITQEGLFRVMVIEAARRRLKSKDITDVAFPE